MKGGDQAFSCLRHHKAARHVIGMTMSRRRWWMAGAILALVLAFPIGWGAYAGFTWLAFGHVNRDASADTVVNRFMPRYDVAEVHRAAVAAPAAMTFAASQRIALRQSPVIDGIFRAREAILRAGPDTAPALRPLVQELTSIGWGVLSHTPGRQVVFGAVTRPWEANVTFRSLPPGGFAAFDSAGYVKIVVSLSADPAGDGSEFREETRALATDAYSRARFRRYWSIFSPGILLIRREALKLVQREAIRSDTLGPREAGARRVP